MDCPVCQHQNPEEAKFCNECGHHFIENAESTEVFDRTESERKHVTIMFSDLSGYTAMTERLDPEDVKEIMNRIFGASTKIIRKYGGFIEKFIGDEVMVVFGVPKAHEDDPVRAIRSAIEIHSSVEAFSSQVEKKIGRPLAMHTGINTGLVVTGEVDVEKGTHGLTGDAINLASRFKGLAEVGEIVVGPATHKAAHRQFIFHALKPTKVKGKSKPIPIYKVLSEETRSVHLHQDRQISSEMVGRDQELAKLEFQILKAVNGEGSVVNVLGEPGIGKSRLLAELRNREVITRINLLEGRSISIGRKLNFHPIIDLLKTWSRVQEEDIHAVALKKIEAAIRTVCEDETDEVFPFVATMMGMKLYGRYSQRIEGIEGEALEKLIFKNIRELLVRSTELVPIVIVLEDLHWADTTSLELLESLFGLVRTHRLVFINVFRPGYWQKGERKIETLTYWYPDIDFSEIYLTPLSKQMGEDLLDNMLQVKGLPYSIKQQIIDRSGGNPFFIEEIVRSLIDESAIIWTNDTFEVTDKIDRVLIPSTINDVLIARIDRLEEQTRNLIKIASVIGRSFFDKILKDVAESIEGIDQRLSYLKDVQLIRDRIRMKELEYLFKHALAQEAAYEITLIQQRKDLHRRVAQSMERVFKERLHEFYGMLAFHYSKADVSEKAEEYMMMAGEEALRSSASNEALHYFQEALQLYLDKYGNNADPIKLAACEMNIATAFYNKAQWSQAVEYFDKVLSRWGMPLPKKTVLGYVKFVWDLLVITKTVYLKLPDSRKTPGEQENSSFELYYKVLQSLPYVDNTMLFLGSVALLRYILKYDLSKIPKAPIYVSYISGGLYASGLFFKFGGKLLEISTRYANKDDLGNRMGHAFATAMVYHCQGEWEKINELDEDLFSSSTRAGDFWNVSTYLWSYGLIKGEQGEFILMNKVIDKLFELREIYDYPQSFGHAMALKVDYLIKTKSTQKALIESEKGIVFSRDVGTESQVLMFLGFKAEAQQLVGDVEGASDSLSQISALYQNTSSMFMPLFEAPYKVASLLIDIEQLKYANRTESFNGIDHLTAKVLSSCKAAGKHSRKYAPYRIKIYRLMGEYYWLIDKQPKAIKWWNVAIEEGKRLGARLDLSRAYLAVGKRLMEPHSKYTQLNGINIESYLEKAMILFEDMNLQRDLDELEKITADN